MKKGKSDKKKKLILIAIVILLIILAALLYVIGIRNNNNSQNITTENTLEKQTSNNENQNNRDYKLSPRIEEYIRENEEKGIIQNYAFKPIIYIYPEQETKITVKVGNPQNLTHTYPKYEEGWEVIAKPNGNLLDCKTGRNLYALYWEGINTVEPNIKEGFVVKGEDTIQFLEEKLEILGLNQREANEFIIYWLPKLESNKYNFIRFQTKKEINENMPLEITPEPDTIIRVLMEYKALEQEIKVKEQQLETAERTGYTVVEWGGTEIH